MRNIILLRIIYNSQMGSSTLLFVISITNMKEIHSQPVTHSENRASAGIRAEGLAFVFGVRIFFCQTCARVLILLFAILLVRKKC